MTKQISRIAFLPLLVVGALAQSSPPAPSVTPSSTYVPGVTFQTTNPNYFMPNPFYFEGRVDWNLLKITQPANPWDYMQRGLHEQDDLGDTTDAIADYQMAVSMNNLANNTCQLVTVVPTGPMNPPPCIFTVRLRLAGLLRDSDPTQAISLYQDVLNIDPLHLGVNAAIGEVYTEMAEAATDPATAQNLYQQAITAYQAELVLSPTNTTVYAQVMPDKANNAHVHWSLAEIYRTLNQTANEMSELNLYLQATQWHSDTYVWHIQLAKNRLAAADRARRSTH